MAQKTWTLAVLRGYLQTLLQDSATSRWADADLDYGINAAIRSAPPLGEYGFTQLSASLDNTWQWTVTVSSVISVTHVYLGTRGMKADELIPLPPEEWSAAYSSASLIVFTPTVGRFWDWDTKPYVVARYLKAPAEVSATGDTTCINAQYVIHYAAAELWSLKAAEAHLVEARAAHTQAQWHYLKAMDIKEALLTGDTAPGRGGGK